MRRPMIYIAVFLILSGMILLARDLFQLSFNTMNVFFALIVILLGVYLLTGQKKGMSFHASGGEQTVIFASSIVIGSRETVKYTVVFSSATLQLPVDLPDIVRISCLFSGVRVVLPENRAVRVRIASSFASCAMPGANLSGIGTREILLGEGVASFLSADAVFSSLHVSWAISAAGILYLILSG